MQCDQVLTLYDGRVQEPGGCPLGRREIDQELGRLNGRAVGRCA